MKIVMAILSILVLGLLVGVPAALAWSFMSLLVGAILHPPEPGGAQFFLSWSFLLGIVFPLVSLITVLVAEVWVFWRVYCWKLQVSRMAEVEARHLQSMLQMRRRPGERDRSRTGG